MADNLKKLNEGDALTLIEAQTDRETLQVLREEELAGNKRPAVIEAIDAQIELLEGSDEGASNTGGASNSGGGEGQAPDLPQVNPPTPPEPEPKGRKGKGGKQPVQPEDKRMALVLVRNAALGQGTRAKGTHIGRGELDAAGQVIIESIQWADELAANERATLAINPLLISAQ